MSPWIQSMTGTVCADSGIRAQSTELRAQTKTARCAFPTSANGRQVWGHPRSAFRKKRCPRQEWGMPRDLGQPDSLTGHGRSLEAGGFGVGAHGGDAVGYVVVEGNVELGCAFDDVVAIDTAREGLVLHFLSHAGDVDIADGLCGLDERTGGEEAGELIAGEEGFGELGYAWDAGVFRVAEDSGAHFFGPSLLGEYGDANEGMFFARGVFLVVEVVEERGDGPDFKK